MLIPSIIIARVFSLGSTPSSCGCDLFMVITKPFKTQEEENFYFQLNANDYRGNLIFHASSELTTLLDSLPRSFKSSPVLVWYAELIMQHIIQKRIGI